MGTLPSLRKPSPHYVLNESTISGRDVVLLRGLLPIFLFGCEIKSGWGLGTRLLVHSIIYSGAYTDCTRSLVLHWCPMILHEEEINSEINRVCVCYNTQIKSTNVLFCRPYPIFICTVDIISFINKVFHFVQITLSSCHVKGVPLT